MSTAGEARGTGGLDPVLLRLLPAGWTSLPVLAAVGVICVGFVALLHALGDVWQLVAPAIGVVLCAPILLYAVRKVSAQIFVLSPRVRPRWQSAGGALVLTAPPAILASLTTAAALVSTSHSIFQTVTIIGCISTVTAGLIAIVAIPLAVVREEVRLSTIVAVAFYATVRRPLPATATVSALATLVWASLSWFPGGIVLVPGLAVLLSIASSWATLRPAGVELPALAVTRTRVATARATSR